MEEHRFPWAHTCEELFISWLEYEKIHPFKWCSELVVKENVRRGCHMVNLFFF
jgi:hypothetical protein